MKSEVILGRSNQNLGIYNATIQDFSYFFNVQDLNGPSNRTKYEEGASK